MTSTETLIEEAVQKIIKAVNKRLESFELNAIDRYTESCISSELKTIASKSAEVEREKSVLRFLEENPQKEFKTMQNFRDWFAFYGIVTLKGETVGSLREKILEFKKMGEYLSSIEFEALSKEEQ